TLMVPPPPPPPEVPPPVPSGFFSHPVKATVAARQSEESHQFKELRFINSWSDNRFTRPGISCLQGCQWVATLGNYRGTWNTKVMGIIHRNLQRRECDWFQGGISSLH